MNQFLPFFILAPLLGLGIAAIPNKNRETLIFWTVTAILGMQWLGLTLFSAIWLIQDHQPLFKVVLTYFQYEHSTFSFDLYFDKLTMVYGFVAGMLGTLIAIFSRYYMHRDPGYKRFFNNLLFFIVGLNVVIFSGNLETLFLGWEVLGISSFLLIGFYRERYLPVKNAIKVISLFRLSDVLLLIAIWLCHAAFGRNILFSEFSSASTLQDQLMLNPLNYFLIPIVFLMVASIKSAQFPFSSWLPRAMEGPTTSSAIFYGSLSVHIGLFLMLRIWPFWMDNMPVRILVIAMGIFTSVVSSSIANVQPTVKTQIAYSSIAQIGLMFIEVALGLHILALVHFAGNALLRSYQLLVSPSALNYLIHDQFYNFEKPVDKISPGILGKLRSSVFMLAIKEFNLDRFQFHVLWTPFKWIGRRMGFLSTKFGYAFLAILFVMGIAGILMHVNELPTLHKPIAFGFALVALLLVLAAFSERLMSQRAWLFIILGHLFINIAISYNVHFDLWVTLTYLSGITVAGCIGWIVLTRLNQIENTGDLQGHYGHIYEHPRFGMVFLFSGLALAGFPITPTFIGLDLVLGEVHTNQIALLVLVGLSYVFIEIAVLRIYARVFLGQHVKAYHARAFRNS